MKLYAQRADLLAIVHPHADTLDKAIGKPISDDAVMNSTMQAQGEVDAYLRNFYPIPLEVVPAVITKATAAIALRMLYKDQGVQPPEYVRDAYGEAVTMMQTIRRKKLSGVDILFPPTEEAEVRNEKAEPVTAGISSGDQEKKPASKGVRKEEAKPAEQ